MAVPELVLHVGLQQTGARMLRRALSRLRPQLHRHGVGLVGEAALAGLGADGWRCDASVDPAAAAAFEQGLAALVDQEADSVERAAGRVRAIVLSSDHLLGRRNLDHRDEHELRPFAVASIQQVIGAVDPARARLLLYVRRQDRLMEACYLRSLQNGGTRPFEEHFPRRFEPALDYRDLIARLENIPDVVDVRTRPFELVGTSAASYAHDVVCALDLSAQIDLAAVGDDLIPYRLYSQRAATIALDVNADLDSDRDQRLVRDFLLGHFPGTDDESTRVVTTDDRRRILAAYATANRGLFERWMPDLPRDGYDSDEATARLIATGSRHADLGVSDAPRRRRGSRVVERVRRCAGTGRKTIGATRGHVEHVEDVEDVEDVDNGARRYPAARSVASEPRVDEVTFPIDVVYTWVDGTDPEWLAGKMAALREVDPTAHTADADDPSRYQSHDELRYSLRSMATFADFVRHIFIVTDGQVPTWLDTGHPRLTVVDHREIFPEQGCLPTFNSHAIESRLHHIEGLAEHYLYCNDDFFLGRRLAPDRFFHANGLTKFFSSPARIPVAPSGAARSVDAAAQNTRRVIHQRFGRQADHKLKHTPYPQRRSVLFEMEAAMREEFARTAASRVRSIEDLPLPSSLFHYYAYLTGRAVPGRITSRYVSLGEAGLSRRLRGLRRRRDFDVLCVNDSVDAHTDDLRRRSRLLQRFMASYWPTASPFER
jgi:hypothetical protein